MEPPRNIQAFMFAVEDSMMPFQPLEKRGPRTSWSFQRWHMTDTVRKVSCSSRRALRRAAVRHTGATSSCATQSALDTLVMCTAPAQVNVQLVQYLARTHKAMGCATVTLVPVVEVAKDLLLSNPGAPSLCLMTVRLYAMERRIKVRCACTPWSAA